MKPKFIAWYKSSNSSPGASIAVSPTLNGCRDLAIKAMAEIEANNINAGIDDSLATLRITTYGSQCFVESWFPSDLARYIAWDEEPGCKEPSGLGVNANGSRYMDGKDN